MYILCKYTPNYDMLTFYQSLDCKLHSIFLFRTVFVKFIYHLAHR